MIIFNTNIKIWDLFRLMDCEKKSPKIHFSSAYLLTLFEYLTSFLGEMKSNIVMSIYTYLFPMCLVGKTTLFFHIL